MIGNENGNESITEASFRLLNSEIGNDPKSRLILKS